VKLCQFIASLSVVVSNLSTGTWTSAVSAKKKDKNEVILKLQSYAVLSNHTFKRMIKSDKNKVICETWVVFDICRVYTSRLWLGTKPDVCENGFPSLKAQISCLQFKQAFYPLRKLLPWLWQHKNTFVQAFRSVPGCQTCLCKRGINFVWNNLLTPEKNILWPNPNAIAKTLKFFPLKNGYPSNYWKNNFAEVTN